MSFKLSVVDQVERGELTHQQAQKLYGIQGGSTVLVWLRKHGTLDWNIPSRAMGVKRNETPSQQIKRLEKELADERLKNKILNHAIDYSDQHYGTSIRKKCFPKQSGTFKRSKE